MRAGATLALTSIPSGATSDGSLRLRHREPSLVARMAPASERLVFDARHRAGMRVRGFRFSIRIPAGARELELAEISARSLGVSGAGRG